MILLAKFLGVKRRDVAALDLPAGWTCPKAGICKTRAARDTGRITRFGSVLCYAAKAEAYLPAARAVRWRNLDQLKGRNVSSMVGLLSSAMPEGVKVIRVHSSGDFFSLRYFQAWVRFAEENPNVTFFGYTKILDYAVAPKPDNFYLNYSYGSMDDERWNITIPTCFIAEHPDQHPFPVVCGSKEKSHEDYFAILDRKTFVISLH